MKCDVLRALDERATVLRVAERLGTGTTGWLRAVRQATEIKATEAASRAGLVKSELFRMERSEAKGVIEMQTLRRAAAALGCDLIYGLAPKKGSFADWQAAEAAARVERRKATRLAWLARAKEKRLKIRQKKWEAEQAANPLWRSKEWSKIWFEPLPHGVRKLVPQRARNTPFWKEQMRKGLRKALRKHGIRLK